MQEKHLFKRIIDIVVPLLFLIGITLMSSFLYLYKGIAAGDDVSFHLGNIYDTYYGLTHGLGIDSTNHFMMGIYAYNTHLFYAPLPHYFAALLMVIFSCSNIIAIKLSITFFCFIAALFFYLFARKISNNMTVSLLGAAFFIFCPYRMFCGYCRFAYAETIAISLLPMLFYGIYSFTHDEKPTYRTFVAIILSVSGLVLSHPFTALSAVIVALIYMAIRYRNTWNMLRNKKGFILSISTVVLIIGFVGFYIFPMLISKGNNLYRVSDNDVMWTNYNHVADSTKSSGNFSGFLNIDWINARIEDNRWPTDQPLYTYLVEIFLVLGAWALLAASDCLTHKFLKNKYLALSINVIAFWILPLTFIWLIHDIVFYLAITLINAIYLINKFWDQKYEIVDVNNKDTVVVNKAVLIDVIFLLAVTIINILFIFIGQMWHLVPSLFYTCQFAWRLWSIVTLSTSWLFVIFLNWSIKSKRRIKFISPLLVFPSLMMVLTMSFREKGVALSYEQAGAYIIYEYDENNAKSASYIGAMNEYMPQIYYYSTYKSEYANSLYPQIRKSIGHPDQYRFEIEDYLSPAFLIGEGTLTCIELNTPNVTFDASIIEDSLIQLPQFYYDGYEIALTDKATGKTSYAEIKEVDSLVSFYANNGEYTINVTYKGPVVRRVFNIFFYISLGGIFALSTLAIIEKIKEGKKKDNNEE